MSERPYALPLMPFLEHVADELGFQVEELTSSSLTDIAGFDSLRMFELDLVLDEMGAVLTDDQLEGLVTIYDAYRAYQRCLAQDTGDQRAVADG
jgi:acyl carrier protein